MNHVWCVECGDDFDPVENADLDTPLCSSECIEAYWEAVQIELDYNEGRYSGAPVH